MELSHSLTLNEEALSQLPEAKQPVFIFEWLRFLDKVLLAAQKSDIRGCQRKLVDQLTARLQCPHGPPTRRLIARCLATLFSVGDTFLLFDTVNKCNDILRHRDDTPSYLSTKLAAIAVLGCMYERLGRMMGRSYEETVQILTRSLKNAESQMRAEIMATLEKLCAGMGTAITSVHKDVYKACRHGLTDRAMSVRCASARCLLEMLNHNGYQHQQSAAGSHQAQPQQQQLQHVLLQTAGADLEGLVTLCFRAFDASNYEVHCAVAKLLGTLMAATQQQAERNLQATASQNKNVVKTISLEEALGLLMSGFLRGGVSFLKGTGEMIKGSSGGNREVRVGVTHAYVVFAQAMGGQWLERNITAFLTHILDLVANPKAASSHVDAVYSRKCISFILHSVLGKMLGEKAQASACKEIAHIIVKQMNSIDFNPENAKDCNQETLFGQHLLVCALQEMGRLILGLGTQAQILILDPALNFIEATVSVLVHPCQAARLAAAWCLRCICIAVPSEITPLVDRCVAAIENMSTSPEAIAGHSGALCAVLSSVRYSPLGIPHTKGKIVFNTAEELLRSASQNSRLSLNRTQAGWLLIGSIMTLGTPVVKGLLPRMLLLWRNSFPRSAKELESEKARGDAFTWQVTLEGRAGALSAMHSFLLHCPELISDEYVRRLLTPIESALAMLISISSVLKSYGQQLKAPAAMVRLRMYEALYLLPPAAFEGSYTHLLRMLVSEFTLGENPANTTTSQLQAVCHSDDYVILGSWLQATDHRTIEDQLQPNSAAGSGALEHDPCCLYRQLQSGEHIPGPLPLGVAVIDMSVSLFGQIFPYVANKHRLQMLDHFSECIKMAKASRQEAVQMNVFTALLMGLKGLTDAKSTLGQEDVKKSATALIVGALTAPNPILRCAAGEAVGRISQVVQDSRFTAEMAQTSFDRLKSARDVASRTGHSLALGCLHRYVGSMGTSQHLTTSVSILLALAQDLSSPTVQVWSLHALALIADSGGPMFRGYVEPTLSVALRLLLDVSQTYVDVHQCIGKLLSALITTIGPELQGNTITIAAARSSFLCACSIMHDNADPSVRAEATGCLQQLHLFAPRHVNLSSLVPMLCRTLASSHLLLRKAAVSCLRQLAQREAKEICEHAATLIGEDMDGLIITESGLPGVLFGLLDSETDARLVKDIHDTLLSMLQMLAAGNLTQWLALCKSVLTIASETATNQEDGGLEDENDDDQMEFHAEDNKSSQTIIQPRWPTRVFAAECVQKIIIACESDCMQHFDLLAAKEMQLTKSHADFLVLHLSDLIRMAFMAITSDSDQLRLEGLKTLQEIIDKFARVSEPEFPGHLLLEQFQAQIDAALRHVFSPDTPSHVTAAACDVCSTWIRSGVARDLNDLRRVHQLLVSSLGKLNTPVGSSQLYNESMATLEKLSILKAWAEVYTAAMIVDNATLYSIDKHQANIVCSSSNGDDFGDFESRGESLLVLVQPELADLSGHWLAALRDHALLSLPAEFASQLPHDGGAFYTTDTMESSRVHYASRWPAILHAAALWISNGGFEKESLTSEPSNQLLDKEAKTQANSNVPVGDTSMDRFYLLFGICMEALCGQRTLDNQDHARTCLQALHTLLDTAWARNILMLDRSLAVELCNVLHRLIITRDTFDHQFLCTKILQLVIKAANENLEARKKTKLKEMSTQEEPQSTAELDNLGEGGTADNIAPGQSLVFAILEVCLCLLVRQIPALNPSCFNNSGPNEDVHNRVIMEVRNTRLNEESGRLVATVLLCMESLPRLCSPEGALAILPTILYLTTGVFKETVSKQISDESILADTLPVQYAVKCLRSLATDKYGIDSRSKSGWARLLQSALGKLIDLAKTGSEKNKIDETAMMQAIAVFVLHSPSGIVNAPNLLYPCINHFRQCLQSENNKVKLKCVQTLKMIFEHTDRNVVTPYIHALAPRIIAGLYGYANPSRDLIIQQTMLKTMDELNTVLESITTVEALIALAEPSNRIQMLTLLVPILIGFLLDGSMIKLANKNTQLLHEHSLQWLMKIGPKYAQEFKALMSQASDLRLRLETAIREQALAQQSQQQHDRNRAKDSNNARSQQSIPTIKLKTDFSNFS